MHQAFRFICTEVLSVPAVLSVFSSCSNPCESQKYPNVLLIMTDDQGWGDIRIHGNPLIDTPTIDSLFKESIVFNKFMVCPLSAPTRASLLTGRYHLKTGVTGVDSGKENLNPEETTLAELFRAAGYATGCFGKWHNGAYYPYTPNGQGFDEFYGFCCGHWSNYFNPILQHNEDMVQAEGYITDILTDAAIEFISQHKREPFFCYVPYNAPHSPFQVPDEYFNKYKSLLVPDDEESKKLASIYAMVECVDYNVSRLLATLDKLDIRENTIVVFMTDNGPVHVRNRFNGNMRGTKGSVHEEGVRVPFYINWKGHFSHRIVNELYAHIDVLPTLMDLCGINEYETSYPIDGISMLPAINGSKSRQEREIFTHRLRNNLYFESGGLRTGSFRLVLEKGRTELYNMIMDPGEKNNIFDSTNIDHLNLKKEYISWFESAKQGLASDNAIPVGYDNARQVRIPSPEGEMYGRLKCYGYPNQNWTNHFMTPSDSLSFEINVIENGSYAFYIDYGNSGEKEVTASVLCDKNLMTAELPVFINGLRYSPDRVE